MPLPKEQIDEAKSAFKEYGQLQNLEFADIPEEKDLQEVIFKFFQLIKFLGIMLNYIHS